ncbi:MAG TPA: hypothetical protein VGN32_06420 [Ktedonobacterales bacterium]|nr:hypothetical protein [Ktedonobacterales bacterium]
MLQSYSRHTHHTPQAHNTHHAMRATPVARRPFVALALSALALLLLVLAGCGPSTQASGAGAGPSNAAAHLPSVTITAHDFSFDMPSTIPAGLVHITFVNQGDAVHQAQFFHLLPGVTAAQFIAALKQGGPASTRSYGVPFGGADETAAGHTVQVIDQIAPGDYVAACLVFDPVMHMFHYSMGMLASFTATASSPASTALADDGTIVLLNMSVVVPATLSKPGLRTFKVINDGPGVHALDILQLAPGKTAQDAQNYLSAPSGPPPYILLGGMGGLAPTAQGWIITQLRPGDYVAACLVVDPVTHLPHAAMGMLAGFTVA